MKILLLDIETAPHRVFAWGLWDQDIHLDQIEEPGYTLCWAAKWFGQREVLFASRHADGHEPMIRRAHELLDEADAVVHYNGKKFDIPTLNQEFAALGMPPPAPYKEIDLLLTARKRFRLPSNKLDYAARYFGLQGKLEHKGMELWLGCMRGDAASWRIMERYNKRDVTELEGLYKKVQPWIIGHPNHGLYEDANVPVCPNCGGKHLQRRGLACTSTMSYQRYQCQSCGAWSRGRQNTLSKGKRESLVVATA